MSKPTVANVKSLISSSGLDFPITQMQYDVQIWKVTYETSYTRRAKIVASGMAYIPHGDGEEFSYLAFAHTTIAANTADAPSELPLMADIQNVVIRSDGFNRTDHSGTRSHRIWKF